MRLNRRQALKATLSATALGMPFIHTARAAGGELRVYNWADYIAETTLADFEAATGIKVAYDNYDSAEAAEAKLMAGSSGFDLVVTASRNIPRFVPAGIIKKFDKAKIANYGKLDPSVMAVLDKLDPGTEYSVPYMWGTTGVTFNTGMIDKLVPNAPYDSLDMIFDPDIMAKLESCGVNMLDSPGTLMPMFLAYLGKDPLSDNPADLDAVVEAFAKVRKHVRSFDNNNYTSNLANQEICVTTNWAGDYAAAVNRAKEAGLDVPLRYEVPKTGGTMWLDVFVMPSDAKNVDQAHAFLNFLMEPEVIAKISNYTAYANAIPSSAPFVDKAILENPAVYPDAEVMKRVWLPKAVSPEYEAARTRAWTKIMTGS